MAIGGAATHASPALALTCAESGATPGVMEAVLDGSHPRADRWQVIAAGSVTSIEPLDGDYGSNGAWIEMDVSHWFRGSGERALRLFDPPSGMSGVGFQLGESYVVLASDDLAWEGRLATGLCELTHHLTDLTRVEQLADRFGATTPDTALRSPATVPWRPAGAILLLLALVLVHGSERPRNSRRYSSRESARCALHARRGRP